MSFAISVVCTCTGMHIAIAPTCTFMQVVLLMVYYSAILSFCIGDQSAAETTDQAIVDKRIQSINFFYLLYFTSRGRFGTLNQTSTTMSGSYSQQPLKSIEVEVRLWHLIVNTFRGRCFKGLFEIINKPGQTTNKQKYSHLYTLCDDRCLTGS